MKFATLSFFALAVIGLSASGEARETTPMPSSEKVSLDAFTMMPLIRSVSVSDDGKKLAILRATSKEGDYIIEIRNPHNLSEKPIVLGADKMMVSGVVWLNNNKLGVMFRQILKDGASKFWTNKFAIISADGKGSWLIPFKDEPRAGFSLIDRLPDNDNEVLVETDLNRNYIPDVVRFNINTGRSVTVMRGSTKISGGFISDHDGDIRAAQGWNFADNAIDLFAREKNSEEWKLIKQISPKSRESYSFAGFSVENPNEIYVNANLGNDKTGIYLYNIKTGTYSERLFGLENVDADGVIFDRNGKTLGFSYTNKHPERYFVDDKEQALYDALAPLFKDKFVSIISRSNDDNVLVVRTTSAKDSGSFYVITDKKSLEKIGERLPFLQEDILSSVKYVSYTARDGRKINAYVTLPKGKAPFPAVVLPHGGPWVRDTILFDEWAQLLASNGYVVIQPNYRGSTGYGIEHWTAGDENWGLKMQDDLDDAALFLVEKGLATKDKLAMFGWSYGGYAAFAASMRDNNIYQCTVAGAGVSDLSRINATLNDSRYLSRLQRPTIKGISPLEQVEKVNVPILVIHGDIDSRVPVEHSRAFVKKLEEYKKDYKYVELKDADHFSDTLFYNHKTILYTELLNWLDNKCGLK
ncbi:alpha/beta hydrolase family protein [Shewanella vaxholmensis]|uniref:Prolyl oligopeptidase family serine peptidase n=1 Tax=Shewanella vaxholmensis TaxID=3063535 RepID=A0ABU9UWP1_9GAMM